VNNRQNGTIPGFNPGYANRMPPLLLRLAVDAARLDKAVFVLERQRRQFK
jgi:hypothetical protein